ncbi:MAG: thermonuclease family protein [Methyloceanibacter sp.]
MKGACDVPSPACHSWVSSRRNQPLFRAPFRFGLRLRTLRAAERHGRRGQGWRDACPHRRHGGAARQRQGADGTNCRARRPSLADGQRGEEALSKLASGAEVELRYGGTRTDRHGYALAQVYVVKGGERIWLQGEMVGEGLARVYSFPDNYACVSELLAREADARTKGEGVWGSWAYRVLAADNVERLGRLTRSYQLVEGVVAQVGESSGRIYLNFDKDWRKDFTVLIERKDGDAFKAAGIDPKALAGKKLRVRGWIEWRNGPMIHVTQVEQIEPLPDGGGSPRQAPEAPAAGLAL